jgi:hypothetical protein
LDTDAGPHTQALLAEHVVHGYRRRPRLPSLQETARAQAPHP